MADEKSGVQAVRCSECGHEFSHRPGEPADPGFQGKPCPECGNPTKTYSVVLPVTARGRAAMSKTVSKTISVVSKSTASMSWVHTGDVVREYWEKHPVWLGLTVVLVVGSPFLGAAGLVGWAGVAAGEAAGFLSFGAGLKGLTKVREIRREEKGRGGDH